MMMELKEKIFGAYTTFVLEHEKFPTSVFNFCRTAEIEEADFYKTFGSLDAIKNSIFETYFVNAFALISKDDNYGESTPKDKLLSFYFTFFEVLLLNRSYVLFTLGNDQMRLSELTQLKSLRKHFKGFAVDLIDEGNAAKENDFTQHSPKIFSEAAWIQLLFLLKFWLTDTSPSFEKTDIAIEKSVRTAFDVFDNTPLDSLFDFGKFIWKEKIKTN